MENLKVAAEQSIGGAYHRTIRLHASGLQAVSDIEDDFHRFRITVRHDGQKVTWAGGEAVRFPWSACPQASGALVALKGMPISTDPTALYVFTAPHLQCTHQFEMAGLAVTQAARGDGERIYESRVTDEVDGEREAVLKRDGQIIMHWRLDDGTIADGPLAGRRPSEFRSQALGDIGHDEAEALLVLRRAVAAAFGRSIDIDSHPNAGTLNRNGACFVLREGVSDTALRAFGSIKDFSHTAPPPAGSDAQGRPQ